ncbi:gamma-mobile-trio protein GmtX [Vibrio fluvialis]|uniref:gamma-mobile-trio protein GmtX n=1 Tax=Vibrio fluvialis TaxID=676 RepID=UPI0028DDE472|nr:gamma-mobile-trio protein GmtX [Vibrio fluvialis]MDT8869938.1 gamma-mobile-trio protein GmtX [Vibrio fluvialis]MDT8877708.1 gamma-mobile-trio protein GmtX [Vibrio fluvialis]
MTTDLCPEKVLKQLKSNASSRTQSSLDAVFTVCKEQQERGLSDFSYSTIARLGKGRGVPAAQSIRNKTGEPYRTLIASFISAVPESSTTQSKTPLKGKSYSWIDELEDPVVRLQANILYSQKKEAEKLLQEVVPLNQVIEVFDGVSSSSSSYKLTELERSALEYILSPEFLRRNQLELGENGSIVSSDKKKSFLPVATIDAIKKALQYI